LNAYIMSAAWLKASLRPTRSDLSCMQSHHAIITA